MNPPTFPERIDRWFWASKLHFFIAEVSFYNFPYTFGFLLSQALFAQFRRDGAACRRIRAVGDASLC